MRIAILSAGSLPAPYKQEGGDVRFQDLFYEDNLLVDSLAQVGFEAQRIPWSASENWGAFDAANRQLSRELS